MYNKHKINVIRTSQKFHFATKAFLDTICDYFCFKQTQFCIRLAKKK